VKRTSGCCDRTRRNTSVGAIGQRRWKSGLGRPIIPPSEAPTRLFSAPVQRTHQRAPASRPISTGRGRVLPRLAALDFLILPQARRLGLDAPLYRIHEPLRQGRRGSRYKRRMPASHTAAPLFAAASTCRCTNKVPVETERTRGSR
jgi:hypothetical protein